ncbi:MAG TPA: histidine kinase [Mycobacteriales bacterium]|nr:histidine kinase [Mycobacteriales bacterium]
MTMVSGSGPPAAAPDARGADPRPAWEESVLLVEAEADRLADDMHNGLMQSLVVARHAIGRQAADARRTSNDLPNADDAVRDCLAQTRRAVWHLRPRATQPGSLPGALADLAARVAADDSVILEHDTSALRRGLSPARSTIAYRLAQAVVIEAIRFGVARLSVEVVEDPFGAVVVRHDTSAEVDSAARESAWVRRGEVLGVRFERRA